MKNNSKFNESRIVSSIRGSLYSTFLSRQRMHETIPHLGPLMLCFQSTESVDIWLMLMYYRHSGSKPHSKTWTRKHILFQKIEIAAVFSHTLEVLSKNPQDRQIDPDRADIYL